MRVPPLPALTSVRGLAAWWVVLYHVRELFPASAPPGLIRALAQGYLAVDLFFILSGFVIALNYAAPFARWDMRQYRQFLGLRLARIYPLHLFILLLFLANPLAQILFSRAGTTSGYPPGYFVLSLLLIQNWGFTDGELWNVPAWSISAEWFAYLLFPAAAWIMARWVSTASASAALAVALVAILGVGMHLLGGSLGADIAKFGLFRCVTEFGAGMALCQLRASLTPSVARANLASAAALVLLVLSATLALPDFVLIPSAWILLIFGLAEPRALLARLLAGRTLEWIGVVSYATYLCHWFVRSWIKYLFVHPGPATWPPIGIYILVVAVASPLLYFAIEVPCRRALRRIALRQAGRSLAAPAPS